MVVNLAGNARVYHLTEGNNRWTRTSFQSSFEPTETPPTFSDDVVEPISFDDYDRFLPGYHLQEQRDAYQAHRRLSQSGGYFQAVWKRA